jgi:hypothetical protein
VLKINYILSSVIEGVIESKINVIKMKRQNSDRDGKISTSLRGEKRV